LAALSLIVLCPSSAGDRTTESVVRTLSAFIAASVRGLVRDAVLAGPPRADLRFIAEHAGCAIAEAETEADALHLAFSLSRAADLFILYAGHVPETGFVEAVEDFLRSGHGSEHGWVARIMPENAIQRFLPRLAPAVGLLAPRRLCANVVVPSFANLVRATGARTTARLHLRRITWVRRP
jgi:hypothetical protein